MTYRVYSGGTKISLLGYGAMRLPTVDGGSARESNADFDQDLLNAQVKRMLDLGVNYFDTSPAYCRGQSERLLGEALAKSGYARRDYLIATKLSNFAKQQYPLSECKKMLDRSLEALRTDYVDNYLLHSIGSGGYENFLSRYVDNGAVDWLVEERKSGRIRNLGFSFHGDYRAFEWCMANHEKYHWDFAMIQMNYVDCHRGQPSAADLYAALALRRIPVVVMEPLLGGALARFNAAVARELVPHDPEASMAKWALRFCGTHPNVMSIISGMTRTEHIEENAKVFSPFKPCSASELEAVSRAAKAYLSEDSVPCTACAYCMPCPYGLDIPTLLRFRNEWLGNREKASAKEVLAAYRKAVPEPLRRAEHCTGCDRCCAHCPQQIDIPREIAEIDRAIDLLRDEEGAAE